MVLKLTPDEASIATQILEYLQELYENLERDAGDAPVAWPSCKGTDLSFENCPGWTLASFYQETTTDGQFWNSVRGFDEPLASLRGKVEELILDMVRRTNEL